MEYSGAEASAAASKATASIVLIAGLALLLSGIQAIAKYSFMQEILEKKFPAAPSGIVPVIMDSVLPPSPLHAAIGAPQAKLDVVRSLSEGRSVLNEA